MGLDGVELVITCEEEFGISIPDAAATTMVSVGITAKFISQMLAEKDSSNGVCSTAHAFYELRTQFANHLGVPRDVVKPDVPIGTLVPRGSGREWQKIADASSLRGERNLFARKRIPPPEMRIRELIESRCVTRWRRLDGTIDEEAVFQHLRVIVAQQMGVPIESIRGETRYLEDLGI